ncbi:MAG: hypothetical protein MK105_05840 [Crocinitomicaceae bacterium]|nr:hypothetical protein [Crocinitomicaceae bacterium]
MKFTTLLIFFILPIIAYSQSSLKEEYTQDATRVFDAEEIVFYGIDFSNFRLVNPEKHGQENELKKFLTAWMSDFHKSFPKERVKAILKKDIERDLQSVQQRYQLLGDKWIVFNDYRFDFDTLKSILKSYELPQNEGLGLVLIIENFNKEAENVMVNYTFFDIKTKEVLWSLKIQSYAGGAGMTNHWANGLIMSMGQFKRSYRGALLKNKKSRK